jgi:hypothetical protein
VALQNPQNTHLHKETPRQRIIHIVLTIAAMLLISIKAAVPQLPPPATPNPNPTLTDFWEGRAEWSLQDAETGLPVGESETLYMGNNVYWSYLHASYQSAGVADSCGNPVEFPGCITRWISTDGGHQFTLTEPRCLLKCNTCPCDQNDHVEQQQYPRVVTTPDGYFMAYEHHAASFLTISHDGLTWEHPWMVKNTGVWDPAEGFCPPAFQVNAHPFTIFPEKCMAGGPPGLAYENRKLYIFVDLGQNPGHMGCYWAWAGSPHRFARCSANPLFTAASEYGPLDAIGHAANP